MGNTAYQTFYKYFLNIKPERNLTNEIEYISSSKNFKKYQNIAVIPIQHSSGANPRFHAMINNQKLINLIKTIIS
jgi:hypothetical protein